MLVEGGLGSLGSSGLCCHAALDIVLAFADPRAAQIWSGPGGPRIGTGVAGSGDEEASAAGTCEGMTFGSNDAGSKAWRFMFSNSGASGFYSILCTAKFGHCCGLQTYPG